MDQLAEILQSVGYHAVMLEPFLPTYMLLILSAVFPIYISAHASLTRPASAAKLPKKKKASKGTKGEEDGDTDSEEEQKMEGLGPMDALIFPLLAACSLTGLYYLIKWLEDPAMLNRLLNWYFSIFGTVALARLLTDSAGVVTSFVFPSTYSLKGDVWMANPRERKMQLSSNPEKKQDSPLPGYLGLLPLPSYVNRFQWKLRELPSRKLRFKAYIHNILKADFKLGPQGLTYFFIALGAQAYFNLIAKPWWLTNILGFSFVYATLQILSPTTAVTGSLILAALFIYDIYFVFYTPIMVAVATQLDIPAKLLFPRPSGRGDDPTKQALSMLGLGDLVLPGMMIGFALRFDLYLFYLRKQTRKQANDGRRVTRGTSAKTQDSKFADTSTPESESESVKPKFYTATSSWGERFWLSGAISHSNPRTRGAVFSKPYFRATLTGYVVGMCVTLLVMQVYGHAQPALLYLVPGVLGPLWGLALIKGDLGILWSYSEAEEEEQKEVGKEEERGHSQEGVVHNDGRWGFGSLTSFLFVGTKKNYKTQIHEAEKNQDGSNSDGKKRKHPEDGNNGSAEHRRNKRVNTGSGDDKEEGSQKALGKHDSAQRRRSSGRRELLYFSVSLPAALPEELKSSSKGLDGTGESGSSVPKDKEGR